MIIQVRDEQFQINEDLKKKILEYPTPTFLAGLLNFPYDDNKPLQINRNPLYFDKILELYSHPINYYCDLFIQIYKEYKFQQNHFDYEKMHDSTHECNGVYCPYCCQDANIKHEVTQREFYQIEEELTDHLQQFYNDLHFYGFLPLIPINKKYSIDKCLDNIKNGLIKKEIDYDKFIYYLQYLHGCLSGSFVLQSYLDEEWTNGDLDIFVQRHDYEHFFDAAFKNVHSILNVGGVDCFNFKKTLDIKYMKALYIEKKHKSNIYYNDELLVALHQVMFCTSSVEIIPVESPDFIKRYRTVFCMDSIYKVIKMIINNTKIDLIITNYPPQYHIKNFDFDFNKIYFDGYFVNSFDWNAIHNRISLNKDGRYNGFDNSSCITRYMMNLDRIKKYTGRGFYIPLDENAVDINNDNPIDINDDCEKI